ncbi:signal peptidase I [Vitreimonas flagellata]|uniref:signal peptidase I n=1 Tax=Vitreimonas flagellata TaxID=2560861 RepID=UPI001EF8E187|nr:signal peptidase I [Vitreimonas flagellata]
MTTESTQTRRVRPWIAALLTFIGWGFGLYYARQTKAAWRVALLGLLIGLILASALVIAFFTLDPLSGWFNHPLAPMAADLISLGISFIIAIFVWRAVARQQWVEPAGPVRLLGYVAIWLVPLLLSLTLAFAIRFALVQPFHIPAGSMQPTLQIGQYIVVTKWSYGYSRFSAAPFQDLLPEGRFNPRLPERGDIVVFRPTPEPERDFVKRIVGLPGDRIQMIEGVLHINGTPVAHEPAGPLTIDSGYGEEAFESVRETLPNGVSYVTIDRGMTELDNTRVYVVPEGHYFMMGDHRDNSADSRVMSVVGLVPFDNILGPVRAKSGAPAN